MNVRQSKLIPLLTVLVVGCGSGQPQSLQGTVTLDGAPLPSGTIQFLPESGAVGPSVGGKITDGNFVVDAKKGAFGGKFRVEIASVRKTGQQMPMAGGGTTDEVRNFIPAKYNQNSELVVEVVPGQPTNCDFALKSH